MGLVPLFHLIPQTRYNNSSSIKKQKYWQKYRIHYCFLNLYACLHFLPLREYIVFFISIELCKHSLDLFFLIFKYSFLNLISFTNFSLNDYLFLIMHFFTALLSESSKEYRNNGTM